MGIEIGFFGVQFALSTVLQVVAVTGSVAASLLIKQKKGGSPGEATIASSRNLPDEPRLIVFGRARWAPLVTFTADTPDNYKYTVGAGPVGLVDGVERFLLGGREVIVRSTGNVDSWPFSNTYAKLFWSDGADDQVADPTVLAKFPDDYSSDHRGRGVSTLVSEFLSPGYSNPKNFELYGGQSAPEFAVEGRATLCYDPRDGETRWTTNSILIILWYLTADELTLNGMGFDISKFDLTDIGEQADLADMEVIKKDGGVSKRSQLSGSYNTADEKADVLEILLRSAGAEEFRLTNGLSTIRLIDDTPEQTFKIDSLHVISNGVAVDDLASLPNRAIVKYRPSERNFELVELDLSGVEWAKDDDEIARTKDRPIVISLPYCFCPAQASRIGRRIFANKRAAKTQFTVNAAIWLAVGHRFGTIGIPEIGDFNYTLVTGAEVSLDNTGEINAIETPELTVYDPEVDEATGPIDLTEIVVSDLDVPVIHSTTAVKPPAPNEDSGLVVRARWNGDADATDYECSVHRDFGGYTDEPRPITTLEPAVRQWYAETGRYLTDEPCLIRVRAVDSANNDITQFSDIVSQPIELDTTPLEQSDLVVEQVNSFVDVGQGNFDVTVTVRASTNNFNVIDISHDGVKQRVYPHFDADVVVQSGEPSVGFVYSGTVEVVAYNSSGSTVSETFDWEFDGT